LVCLPVQLPRRSLSFFSLKAVVSGQWSVTRTKVYL
jgi:hypothetical protein